MDWAEKAADECLHNCDERTPLRGLIEAALRKAKADGMREAVAYYEKFIGPTYCAVVLTGKAAEIEKGNA